MNSHPSPPASASGGPRRCLSVSTMAYGLSWMLQRIVPSNTSHSTQNLTMVRPSPSRQSQNPTRDGVVESHLSKGTKSGAPGQTLQDIFFAEDVLLTHIGAKILYVRIHCRSHTDAQVTQ